jgi:hypothetical protein
MRKVKNVEKRIWDTVAFDVIIRQTDGRDMRGDKNDVTVADWKARRSAAFIQASPLMFSTAMETRLQATPSRFSPRMSSQPRPSERLGCFHKLGLRLREGSD